MFTTITYVFVLFRPCVQFSIVLWCSQPSLMYLFWTDRVFTSALCSDAHSHHFSISSGRTVCSVQHCAVMYTAITSVFVLDRPCVQFSPVLWCTQPSIQYLFWSDRVFSSALCSDAHSHHFSICSGHTLCSVQHCAVMYTAITSVFFLYRPCVQFSTVLWCTQPSLQYFFCTGRVFSSALCSDAHGHHFSICSGQTVCSFKLCTAMNSVYEYTIYNVSVKEIFMFYIV